ncbi:ATP-binding protein [Dactylosporangium sp. CA-233914]|uniref:ATP-binding protein n=1 Tax=Dactylosporangium sp. CA-233914 TaxID=3239934 RepID=UPI003D915C85
MSGRTHLPSGLVTFLFTDIEGSTRLAQMLGAGYRPVLHEHREVIRRALSKADGVELFTEGDSLFVAFPDASTALAACAEAQRALAAHHWPSPEARPRVRMGLHTGFAEPYGGEYTSPEVHRAARVAAAAHGGQILCSAATAAQAGLGEDALGHATWLLDLGLHRLRGFDGCERIFQLVGPGLERQFPRPRTIDAPAHNLPVQTTRFIGRAAERAAVRDLISRHRLVTVVGAGGAGKTRVAVEAAGEIVERFGDGVWFADLSAVANGDLVDVSVAAALGLRPEPGRAVAQTIADHVRDRRLLVVLDTSDAQLPAARRLVARLLAAGPEVAVLATSREPLGLAGEVVWRIPPLSTEAAIGGGFSDAVALLVDRASAARGGRPVEPGDIGHLTRVAKALEGLPLALELAAARLRLLSAAQLADRIGDVLGTLDAGSRLAPAPQEASDRHRTMQAAVGWSYRTLDPRSARLLRWLSVFASPVDLPAIEWLHDGDPLDPLATLVDKSLLQAEAGATNATYRMLDPIRAYAARLLLDAGEEESARERHVSWCLQAAHDAYLDADGRPVTLSLYTLDPLADELRAALHWTVTRGSARQGLALAGSMDQWWRERGLVREGRMWLFRLYERISATGEPVPDAELAAAYHMHSLHAGADGETVEELRFSQRAESAARRAGDPGLIARILAARGAPLLEMGRTEEVERLSREVIGWSEEQGVAGEALSAVYALAQLLWRRGALDEAADLLASARPLENSRPLERGRRTVDMLLGMVALSRGDLVGAHDHLIVALRSRMTHGFHLKVCETLNAVAVRCLLADDPETAARLFGAAQTARIRLRCSAGPFAAYWTEQQATLRVSMGDAAFDAAYAAGGTLSLEESVALALTIEHPDLMAGSIRFSTVE